ncbi:MAG: methylated-DNA--[protein]-cysteine S-methyltransferase [Bacteroidales bacterium]|jgi:O-6-methylguanine DNA methyltransferase|nr:methylated-DNA--[protein]-cysteine S-methyltransferase [Bacteroidales bacterium]
MNPYLSLTVRCESPESLAMQDTYLKIIYGFAEGPFGDMLVAIAPEGVCELAFVNRDPQEMMADLRVKYRTAYFVRKDIEAKKVLYQIFYSEDETDLSLYLVGSQFRLQVWIRLLDIPVGGLLYYSELAEWMGKPTATRSIASAVADNPIALLVPCHRIIPKGGGVGQYQWGADLKRELILWEHAMTTPDEAL